MISGINYITLSDPSCEARPRHMAYYEFGDKTNPNAIICVHGLSRNGLDFRPLAMELSKHYRVICPDIAGRGYSDWLSNKSDYNYLTYLSDIRSLMTQLGIFTSDWIGTSMGGIIGMMLAASQPETIKRLILNDIGKTVSAEGLKRIISYVGSSSIFTTHEVALAYLKVIIAPFGISSEAHWQFMFDSSFRKLHDGSYVLRYDPDISKPLHETAAKDDAINDIDLSAFWNEVKCQALILRGKTSDILTEKTASEMCMDRTDVKLVEFSGIGHAPALLDEFQINVITDWLDIKT